MFNFSYIETHTTGYVLSQTTYINQLLKKYGMTDVYETDSPIDCNMDLDNKKSDSEDC